MKFIFLYFIVLMNIATMLCAIFGATLAAIVLSAINTAFWVLMAICITKMEIDEAKDIHEQFKKACEEDPFSDL